LASKERFETLKQKVKNIENVIHFLSHTSVSPNQVNDFLTLKETPPIEQKLRLDKILLRPQVHLSDLIKDIDVVGEFAQNALLSYDTIESVEVEVKYKGYLEREQIIADKIKRLEDLLLNPDFDYDTLHNLTIEARQKLKKIKPTNIGQASRISGISPSDINVLLIQLGR